ncbi:hypothetical protein CCYA_CCYA16G4173 [Cyanidiococcus yangmingshanensis]|nr:hypothetical protein CCYA_CCYA16G4173 [Cyanidiococcus yangmingshanensis]
MESLASRYGPVFVLTARKSRHLKSRFLSIRWRTSAFSPTAGHDQRRLVPGVTAVVLSNSLKGGVGKSTVAVGLASALHRGLGLTCGVLDADIYGPSVLHLVRASTRRQARSRDRAQRRLEPLCTESGLKVFGLAALQQRPMEALVWRGPVATRAVQQLVFDVAWAPLDVLVIDTPPGTGDVLLTLAQQVQLQGALLVTTPQQLVETQVRRGLDALQRLSIPVLGVVENMAYFVCSQCHHEEHVFGAPRLRADELAKLASSRVLAQLPLTNALCEAADQGRMDQDGKTQAHFADLAVQVASLLGFPV